MIRNRFFKTLLSYFAEIFIAKKAVTQVDIEAFKLSAVVGDIWAFWVDTNLALAAGDTALPENVNRSFYYALKKENPDGTGVVRTSHPIQVRGVSYSSIPFNAGTAQVSTVTFGGTYAAGQIITLRIIETTGTILPYPTYHYNVEVGAGGIAAAITALVTQINKELPVNEPIVTASGVSPVLTLTGKDKFRNFKTIAAVETTVAQPIDASAITYATTVKQKQPIGNTSSMKELEKYALINAGGVLYTDGSYSAQEFNDYISQVDGAMQYGIVLVKNLAIEKGGAVDQVLDHQAYVIIALDTADIGLISGLSGPEALKIAEEEVETQKKIEAATKEAGEKASKEAAEDAKRTPEERQKHEEKLQKDIVKEQEKEQKELEKQQKEQEKNQQEGGGDKQNY